MSYQPKWQLVENIGDVNPFDHGGFFIFKDLTGRYDLEALIIDPDEAEEDLVYVDRVLLEKCYFTNGVLSDNKYHLDIEAWFFEDLDRVCSYAGMDKEDMINNLCSDDPTDRGWAYKALIGYHGSVNFGGDGLYKESRKDIIKHFGRIYQGYLKRLTNKKIKAMM